KVQHGTKRIPSEFAMDTELTQYTCPECGGPIHLVQHGHLEEYRCRVGHSYSPQSFYEDHKDAEERALWAAIVLLEGGADIAEKLAASQPNLQQDAARKRGLAKTLREMFETVS